MTRKTGWVSAHCVSLGMQRSDQIWFHQVPIRGTSLFSFFLHLHDMCFHLGLPCQHALKRSSAREVKRPIRFILSVCVRFWLCVVCGEDAVHQAFQSKEPNLIITGIVTEH